MDRYNAPVMNEAAVVMVGNKFGTRDIVLRKYDCTLILVIHIVFMIQH